jgi:hypothetical protein
VLLRIQVLWDVTFAIVWAVPDISKTVVPSIFRIKQFSDCLILKLERINLWNSGNHSPNNRASYLRRLESWLIHNNLNILYQHQRFLCVKTWEWPKYNKLKITCVGCDILQQLTKTMKHLWWKQQSRSESCSLKTEIWIH